MDRIPILRMGNLLLVTIQVDMHDQLALTLQDDLARLIADLEIEHSHENLPDQDPHLQEGTPRGRRRHSHAVVIDRLHPEWPQPR